MSVETLALDDRGYPILVEETEDGALFLAGIGVRDPNQKYGNPWHDPETGQFTNAPPGMTVHQGGSRLKWISNKSRHLIDSKIKGLGGTSIAVIPSSKRADHIRILVFDKMGIKMGEFEVPAYDETKFKSPEDAGVDPNAGTGPVQPSQAPLSGPTNEEQARRSAAVAMAARELPDFELETLREFLQAKTKRELTNDELVKFHDDVRATFKDMILTNMIEFGTAPETPTQAIDFLRNNANRLNSDEAQEIRARLAHDYGEGSVPAFDEFVEQSENVALAGEGQPGGGGPTEETVKLPTRVSAEFLQENLPVLTDEQLDEVMLRLTKLGGKNKAKSVLAEKSSRSAKPSSSSGVTPDVGIIIPEGGWKVGDFVEARSLADNTEIKGTITSMDPPRIKIAENGGHIAGAVVMVAPDTLKLPEAKSVPEAPEPTFASGGENFPTLSNLQIDKSLGGTTGAKLYTGPDGKKYVVKHGSSREHIREEAITNALYRAAGVAVPAFRYDETDEQGTMISEFVEGKTIQALKMSGDQAGVEKARALLRQSFVVDALLANWDVTGLEDDNVILSPTGETAWRVDNGGSLRFRAMGASKGGAFGSSVGELDTLRDPSMNATAGAAFADLDDEDLANQILEQLGQDFSGQMVDIVDGFGDDELMATMSARLDYLHQWATEPDGQPSPEPTAPNAPAGAKSPEKFEQALDLIVDIQAGTGGKEISDLKAFLVTMPPSDAELLQNELEAADEFDEADEVLAAVKTRILASKPSTTAVVSTAGMDESDLINIIDVLSDEGAEDLATKFEAGIADIQDFELAQEELNALPQTPAVQQALKALEDQYDQPEFDFQAVKEQEAQAEAQKQDESALGEHIDNIAVLNTQYMQSLVSQEDIFNALQTYSPDELNDAYKHFDEHADEDVLSIIQHVAAEKASATLDKQLSTEAALEELAAASPEDWGDSLKKAKEDTQKLEDKLSGVDPSDFHPNMPLEELDAYTADQLAYVFGEAWENLPPEWDEQANQGPAMLLGKINIVHKSKTGDDLTSDPSILSMGVQAAAGTDFAKEIDPFYDPGTETYDAPALVAAQMKGPEAYDYIMAKTGDLPILVSALGNVTSTQMTEDVEDFSTFNEARRDLYQLARSRKQFDRQSLFIGDKINYIGRGVGTITKENKKSYRIQFEDGSQFTPYRTDHKIAGWHVPPRPDGPAGTAEDKVPGAPQKTKSSAGWNGDAKAQELNQLAKKNQIAVLQQMSAGQIASVYKHSVERGFASLAKSASHEYKAQHGKWLNPIDVGITSAGLPDATPTVHVEGIASPSATNKFGVDTSKIKQGDTIEGFDEVFGSYVKGKAGAILGDIVQLVRDDDSSLDVNKAGIRKHWPKGEGEIQGFAPGDVVQAPHPTQDTGTAQAIVKQVTAGGALVSFVFKDDQYDKTFDPEQLALEEGVDEQTLTEVLEFQHEPSTDVFQGFLERATDDQLARAWGATMAYNDEELLGQPGSVDYAPFRQAMQDALKKRGIEALYKGLAEADESKNVYVGAGQWSDSDEKVFSARYAAVEKLINELEEAIPKLPIKPGAVEGVDFNTSLDPDRQYEVASYDWWRHSPAWNSQKSVGMQSGGIGALRAYTGSGHGPINRHLRGLGAGGSSIVARIKSMDKLFEMLPGAEKDFQSMRGITSSTAPLVLELKKLNVGDVFTDHGFQSSALPGNEWGGYRYAIRVPKGYKVWANRHGDGGSATSEREIIIDRGAQMMYLGEINGVPTFEIIGQDKRDVDDFLGTQIPHAIKKDPEAKKKELKKLKQMSPAELVTKLPDPNAVKSMMIEFEDQELAEKIQPIVDSEVENAPNTKQVIDWQEVANSVAKALDEPEPHTWSNIATTTKWHGDLKSVGSKSGPQGFQEAAKGIAQADEPKSYRKSVLQQLLEMAKLNHAAAGGTATKQGIKGSPSSWQKAVLGVEKELNDLDGKPAPEPPPPPKTNVNTTPPPPSKPADMKKIEPDPSEFDKWKRWEQYKAVNYYKYPSPYKFKKLKVPQFNQLLDIAEKNGDIGVLLSLYKAAAMHAPKSPSWAKRMQRAKAALAKLGHNV